MKPYLATILIIFCSLCPATASPEGKTVFNVRDSGATGDGKTLDSPSINQAIQAASQAGGGTVFIPAGTYLCGSIHLTNNINLYLDAGAVVLGAPQAMNAYDETEPWTNNPFQDGGHCYFHNSLIWGENLTNVSITGTGMINGGGLVRDDVLLDRMSGFSQWSPANREPTPVTSYPPSRLGNKAIALKRCRNVLLRDITIYHGGHFAVLITGCDNNTVDNVTMDTDRDGIDIDCCRDTMVSNCRINSPNDDGLCPKSTYALGEIRPTENITIVNCQVSGFVEGALLDGTLRPARNGYGRIKFGTESSGGFRNCTVANCTFRSCHGLALEMVDGGIMDNITINNLTMMDVRDCAIYITTGKRNRTPGLRRAEASAASSEISGGAGVGSASQQSASATQAGVTTNSRMRNILISNVIADGVDRLSGIQIMGLPEQPLEGIRLENIRLTSSGGGSARDAALHPAELGTGYPDPNRLGTMPAYGIFARHVRDLELANLHVDFRTDDLRPPIQCADVDGLDIDNFKAKLAAGVPSAVLADDVRGIAIRNSPVLSGVNAK